MSQFWTTHNYRIYCCQKNYIFRWCKCFWGWLKWTNLSAFTFFSRKHGRAILQDRVETQNWMLRFDGIFSLVFKNFFNYDGIILDILKSWLTIEMIFFNYFKNLLTIEMVILWLFLELINNWDGNFGFLTKLMSHWSPCSQNVKCQIAEQKYKMYRDSATNKIKNIF